MGKHSRNTRKARVQSREICKRVVFYGGSFDPIHKGHVTLVKLLRRILKAEVVVVPVINWMKPPGLLTLEERISVTTEAFKGAKNVRVVDYALHWDNMESTYEFIRQWKEKFPNDNREMWVAMGADAFVKVPQWHRGEDLLKEIKLVIVTRPGYDIDPELQKVLEDRIKVIEYEGDISSSQIRKKMVDWRQAVPKKVHHLVEAKLDS